MQDQYLQEYTVQPQLALNRVGCSRLGDLKILMDSRKRNQLIYKKE
jgi:hypothetical protein